MSGAIPQLHQYVFMAWCPVEKSTGTTLRHAADFTNSKVYSTKVKTTFLFFRFCLADYKA
jgi:hypothetical protein